jgi:hypothetical protein
VGQKYLSNSRGVDCECWLADCIRKLRIEKKEKGKEKKNPKGGEKRWPFRI